MTVKRVVLHFDGLAAALFCSLTHRTDREVQVLRYSFSGEKAGKDMHQQVSGCVKTRNPLYVWTILLYSGVDCVNARCMEVRLKGVFCGRFGRACPSDSVRIIWMML